MNLRSLQNNFGLILLAVIVSVMLWMHVQGQQSLLVTRTFDFHLVVENVPSGVVVTSRPQRIEVAAVGLREELDKVARVDEADRVAVVDLSDATPGASEYRVRLQLTDALREPRVEWRRPENQLIMVEELVQKEFPVVVEAARPPQGFIFVEADVRPERVTVSGPATRIARIDQVRAQILDLSDFTPGESYTVKLQVLDERQRPVADVMTNPEEVSVYPSLSVVQPRKNVLISPQYIGNPAPGFRLVRAELSRNQVRLSGDMRVLQNLDAIETEPISLEGLTTNTNKLVRLQIPRGVSADLANVEVRLVIEALPATPPPVTNDPPPATNSGER
jgi:YbbR domain-containing protein